MNHYFSETHHIIGMPLITVAEFTALYSKWCDHYDDYYIRHFKHGPRVLCLEDSIRESSLFMDYARAQHETAYYHRVVYRVCRDAGNVYWTNNSWTPQTIAEWREVCKIEDRLQKLEDKLFVKWRTFRYNVPKSKAVKPVLVSLSPAELELPMDDVCGICITIHAKSETVATCCGHEFGDKCLQTWIECCKKSRKPANCPLCKKVDPVLTRFISKPVRKPRAKKLVAVTANANANAKPIVIDLTL